MNSFIFEVRRVILACKFYSESEWIYPAKTFLSRYLKYHFLSMNNLVISLDFIYYGYLFGSNLVFTCLSKTSIFADAISLK